MEKEEINIMDYTTVVNGHTVVCLDDVKRLVADTIRYTEEHIKEQNKCN